MTKKLTLSEIIHFNDFAKKYKDQEWPVSIALQLYKLYNATKEEAEFYYEKLQNIINQYAKHDEEGKIIYSEDGSTIMLEEDTIQQCSKAIDDLDKSEIEITFTPIYIEDLTNIDNIHISIAELISIESFLTDKTNEGA